VQAGQHDGLLQQGYPASEPGGHRLHADAVVAVGVAGDGRQQGELVQGGRRISEAEIGDPVRSNGGGPGVNGQPDLVPAGLEVGVEQFCCSGVGHAPPILRMVAPLVVRMGRASLATHGDLAGCGVAVNVAEIVTVSLAVDSLPPGRAAGISYRFGVVDAADGHD
jgi:hypothetical protein